MPAVATAGGLPTRLGKYEILMPLAAGGMARIYIGRSTGIGSFERHVVLKLITPERANDHTAVQMFLDEARLAASLNHQNVAQVFEVGEDASIHYLAMEYVHGQDLRALLAKAGSSGTRVPLELALTVVTGAAAGLNHAHERRGSDGVPLGIVHRDVSPSNIMIGYDGSVKLLDFGIAKATARSVETQSGIIKGKFAYMAPEQCRGRDVDRRSDVFSLGIILYEVTTQHRCFRADSDFDTMHRIVTGDVVRPTRLVQGYPQALEAIVMKALAVDAAQRYQSAGLLLEAIEAFAISARMPLSTMSLGRFMRDMFGDQQEPWLNYARGSQQPIQPKESTISNTNGSGTPEPAAGHGAKNPLDLPPRDEQQAQEPNQAEWNAKSYPTMQPPYATPQTAEQLVRQSNPQLPVVAQAQNVSGSQPSMPMPPQGQSQPHERPSHAQMAAPLPPPPQVHIPAPATPSAGHPAQTPQGSQPIPTTRTSGPIGAMQQPPPSGQFPSTPGSGSHSGVGPVVASTRQGYASAAPGATRGDMSYPRYEPVPGLDDDADLALKPNRRPLIIGLCIAAAGIVILLVMTLGGGGTKDDDTNKTEPTVNMNPSGGGSGEDGSARQPAKAPDKLPDKAPQKAPEKAPEKAPDKLPANTTAATPEAGKGSAQQAVVEPQETSIKLHVTSEPDGADVMLSGKVIGATPLTVSVPKRDGKANLVVHKAKYADVTKEIDMSGDFEADVTLKKDEPKEIATPEPKRPPEQKKQPKQPEQKKQPQAKTPDKAPPKPACQNPAMYDPTDSRPVCK